MLCFHGAQKTLQAKKYWKYREGNNMVKVAFICVHNSCRSQMAEAIAKLTAHGCMEVYSAGTESKDQINPDAVRVIKELYGIDMEQGQKPKLLADIPAVDIVITMGCNVQCPAMPCKYREDWGLNDPTGKPLAVFRETAQSIEQKVYDLKSRIENNMSFK